jgi:hypothetical protein
MSVLVVCFAGGSHSKRKAAARTEEVPDIYKTFFLQV